MCINCMSQLDMVTISSVGAAGVVSGTVRQTLSRLGWRAREPQAVRDARVAAFLRSLDLDPAAHLDLAAPDLPEPDLAEPDLAEPAGSGHRIDRGALVVRVSGVATDDRVGAAAR